MLEWHANSILRTNNDWFYADCPSVNAEVYTDANGLQMCIALSSVVSRVDQDTMRVESCVEQYGASASLISLPESDTHLWEFALSVKE